MQGVQRLWSLFVGDWPYCTVCIYRARQSVVSRKVRFQRPSLSALAPWLVISFHIPHSRRPLFQQITIPLVRTCCTEPMSFSRFVRKFGQPSLAHPAPAGSGNSPQTFTEDPHERPKRRQASEPTPAVPRPWWRKRPWTMGRSSQYQATSSPLSIPKAQSSAPDVEVPEMPLPMPLPTFPGVSMTNLAMIPPPEVIPAVVPALDKLAEARDAVNDGPNMAETSRKLDSVGSFSVPPPLYLGKADPGI